MLCLEVKVNGGAYFLNGFLQSVQEITLCKDIMSKAVELKGSVMSFTVLKVSSGDIEAVKAGIAEKVSQAPGFFNQVPVVIEPQVTQLDATFLPLLVEYLTQQGMMPIGVRSEDPMVKTQAELSGLAVFGPEKKTARQGGARKQAGAGKDTESKPTAAMVVNHAVRSGQQVYAQGRDLIVMDSVNPGAEVYADGHIHIYGALKGRAFAGAKGAQDAQIFVQNFDPELVCIAGLYQLADDLPQAMLKKPCRVSLEDEQLKFESL